jgi:hypothetical protein
MDPLEVSGRVKFEIKARNLDNLLEFLFLSIVHYYSEESIVVLLAMMHVRSHAPRQYSA